MKTDPHSNVELAAILWPILERASGSIRQVAARAYVLPAGDHDLIENVLHTLARGDFNLAKRYPISESLNDVTEPGECLGGISAPTFVFDTMRYIKPILNALSEEHLEVKGVPTASGQSGGSGPLLWFGENSHTTVIFLVEDSEGNLVPHMQRSHGAS